MNQDMWAHCTTTTRNTKKHLQLATVTSAPNRVSVSVMQLVSISSDPLAIGTSTRGDRFADAEKDLAALSELA